MPVAKKIAEAACRSSWIRQMFEEGACLAEIHGCDKVFDFSIGNPNLDPPEEFHMVLEDLVKDRAPGVHGYMSNQGYPEACAAVAAYLTRDQGVPLSGEHVVMTCGAAAAANVIFKAILDPGDEVIVPRPYFVEYGAYVDNHGGVLKTVASLADFDLDLDAIGAAITSKTRGCWSTPPTTPRAGCIRRRRSRL